MIYQNKNTMTRITATIIVIGFVITQTGLGTAFALRTEAEVESVARANGQDPIGTELRRTAEGFVASVQAVVSGTTVPAAGAAATGLIDRIDTALEKIDSIDIFADERAQEIKGKFKALLIELKGIVKSNPGILVEPLPVGLWPEAKQGERRSGGISDLVTLLKLLDIDSIAQRGVGVANEDRGSRFDDSQYQSAGATMVDEFEQVLAQAGIVEHVKELQPSEIAAVQQALVNGRLPIVYTFNHFANDQERLLANARTGATFVSFENIVDMLTGRKPILEGPSEKAGVNSAYEMAVLLTSRRADGTLDEELYRQNLAKKEALRKYDETNNAPTPDIDLSPYRVKIYGGGVVGYNEALMLARMGANVTVVEINPTRRQALEQTFRQGGLNNVMIIGVEDEESETQSLLEADGVSTTAYILGAHAQKLVTQAKLEKARQRNPQKGWVLIPVDIDQGGGIEGVEETSHKNPFRQVGRDVHYAVPNQPGAIPRQTSIDISLGAAKYLILISLYGVEKAVQIAPELGYAVDISGGRITNPLIIKEGWVLPEDVALQTNPMQMTSLEKTLADARQRVDAANKLARDLKDILGHAADVNHQNVRVLRISNNGEYSYIYSSGAETFVSNLTAPDFIADVLKVNGMNAINISPDLLLDANVGSLRDAVVRMDNMVKSLLRQPQPLDVTSYVVRGKVELDCQAIVNDVMTEATLTSSREYRYVSGMPDEPSILEAKAIGQVIVIDVDETRAAAIQDHIRNIGYDVYLVASTGQMKSLLVTLRAMGDGNTLIIDNVNGSEVFSLRNSNGEKINRMPRETTYAIDNMRRVLKADGLISAGVAASVLGNINEATITRALLLAGNDYQAALNAVIGGTLTREVWEEIKFGADGQGGISRIMKDNSLDEMSDAIDESLSGKFGTVLKEDLGFDSLALVKASVDVENLIFGADSKEIIPDQIGETWKTVGDVVLWAAIAYRAARENFDLFSINLESTQAEVERIKKEITTGVALVISPQPLDRDDIARDLKPFGYTFNEVVVVADEAAAREEVDRINRDQNKTLVVVVNHTGEGLTLTGIGQARIVTIAQPNEATLAVEESL